MPWRGLRRKMRMRREMMTEVIIGSRESKLAVLQSEMVKSYIEQKTVKKMPVLK